MINVEAHAAHWLSHGEHNNVIKNEFRQNLRSHSWLPFFNLKKKKMSTRRSRHACKCNGIIALPSVTSHKQEHFLWNIFSISQLGKGSRFLAGPLTSQLLASPVSLGVALLFFGSIPVERLPLPWGLFFCQIYIVPGTSKQDYWLYVPTATHIHDHTCTW